MLKKLLPVVLALALSAPALAATAAKKAPAPAPKVEDKSASVKEAMEAKLGTKISSVTKSPYLGLYEVYADGQILYTDENLTAIIAGTLIDGATMKNVTAERMQKLAAINFADLPLELAIKQVRGDGRRVLASFEDPNCGYCKRLAKDLQSLKDATVYTFLYPILSPDSTEKSKNIWCAKDKAAAWNDWMVGGKAPAAAAAGCDTSAIDKNVALGQKIKVTGTPTIFTADGNRLPGAVPLAQLEQAMNQAGK